MIKNFISDGNSTLRIVCEEKILQLLQCEFGEYYSFNSKGKEAFFDVYIYVDENKFNNVSKKINNIKNDITCIRDRESIIMINKQEMEIIIFYPKITENNIQLIGEIIISLFGLILESKGYIFMHASCVEKNKRGICILGARRTGKTTILNALLQDKFNFVCNSQLGMKNKENKIVAVGLPTRMGMRVETLDKLTNENIKKRIIQYSDIKNRFGNDIEKKLEEYKAKKFNIKVDDIKEIYGVELKRCTLINMIIIPIYIPGINHIKIKKVDYEEIKEMIYNNKRNGAYGSAKYISNVFFEKSNTINLNLKNADTYMIRYNEMNISEVVNFLNQKLEKMVV